MLNREVINTLRGIAATALRAGLVQLTQVHEVSRAIGALDVEERILIEEDKRRVEEEAKRPKPTTE